MRTRVLLSAAVVLLCRISPAAAQAPRDSALAAYVRTVRAVDNHTHVFSTAPSDSDSDALPLDNIPPGPLYARLRTENSPLVLAAYKALYGYPYNDLSDAHLKELRGTMQQVKDREKTNFPTWVLDRLGTEVMFANRIAMGPGLEAPRFRWVSYVDALLLPLSSAGITKTPDQRVLYPLEEKLLRRYLNDLHVSAVPSSLDGYLTTVVTPTLERQAKAGCIAVKFEAAYLRSLDFDDATLADARRIYAKYAGRGAPTRAEYKTLQDYLFRYVAREAGRLGMAVHIHSFDGAGSYYKAAGADPLLLEPTFNDSTLRHTNFVIIHGGGIYSSHAGALLAKGNVYLDFSLQVMVLPANIVARHIEEWVSQFPEKVLFGTDAFAMGPDAGWEIAAWIGSTTGRDALTMALTSMMQEGEISRARAQEIASMVLRENARGLYRLR